jgi:mannonate dehydratase
MDEEAHRRQTGRTDHAIVFHPDHGHEFLSDIGRGTYSGYPLIGSIRVTRGLSELRGIVHALEHLQNT